MHVTMSLILEITLNIHSKKKISNILTKLTEQILLHKDVQDPANI